MNYRHSFHAGNSADVVKHSLLIALVRALQLKQSALTLIDTHAGCGLYDLDGEEAGDLVAAARSRPGGLNFASAGQGSATHLNAEKFKLAAGISATNIPFKGSAEAVTEVVAGRVDYYFSPIAPVIGQIRAGALVPLAVGSSRRASALPDVPTTAEAGVPGSEFNFWIGMMVPAKTPREIVNRLNAEVVKALALPEVRERFQQLGADPWTMTPEQFDAYIRAEIACNAPLVKAAGLAPAP